MNSEIEEKVYYSQYKQDEFLEKNIFKGFKNGVFVDVGAHDGITLNNTLYFEKNNGWTGINIEPIPEIYEKLKINRPNCHNLNYAICKHNGFAQFIQNIGETEMLSGLLGSYDTRHAARLYSENQTNGSISKVIMVPIRTLDYVLSEFKINHIHYLSIDTEGAEEDVIKSINFNRVFIDVIGFENNFSDTSSDIIRYLIRKNYKYINYSSDSTNIEIKDYKPEIFMIHKDSVFMPKSN